MPLACATLTMISTCSRALLFATTVIACGDVAFTRPDASIDQDAPPDPDVDASIACVAAPTSLKHWWSGDGDSNDVAGSLNGAAIGGVAFAAGKAGQAFDHDGADDYVAIADLDALWPARSFSLEAWFRTTEGGTIISKYECGMTCSLGANSAYSLGVSDDGRLGWSVRDQSSEVGSSMKSSVLVTDGAWHHVVGVFDVDALKMRLYVDGAAMSADIPADQTDGLANTDGEQDPVTIGAGFNAGASSLSGHFRGLLDELSYYDAALSSDEVRSLYGAPAGKCRE